MGKTPMQRALNCEKSGMKTELHDWRREPFSSASVLVLELCTACGAIRFCEARRVRLSESSYYPMTDEAWFYIYPETFSFGRKS